MPELLETGFDFREAMLDERLDELQPGNAPYGELITFVTDRPGHDRRYAIDATHMRERLGWTPAHDFRAGIDNTLQWYLENRQWCDHVRSGEYQNYLENQYGERAVK